MPRMKEYVVDVRCHLTVRVRGANESEARERVRLALNGRELVTTHSFYDSLSVCATVSGDEDISILQVDGEDAS